MAALKALAFLGLFMAMVYLVEFIRQRRRLRQRATQLGKEGLTISPDALLTSSPPVKAIVGIGCFGQCEHWALFTDEPGHLDWERKVVKDAKLIWPMPSRKQTKGIQHYEITVACKAVAGA